MTETTLTLTEALADHERELAELAAEAAEAAAIAAQVANREEDEDLAWAELEHDRCSWID